MKTYKNYISVTILITVTILLIITGYIYFIFSNKVEISETLNTETQQSDQPIHQTSTTTWKTFSNTFFTFNYPDILSLKQDGENITLSHSIAYKHNDFGNMKGGPEAVLDRFTDFNLSLEIVSQNPKDMILAKQKNGYSFQSFNIGSLYGFTTTEGFEGSGHDIYYFTVTPGKTLVVKRTLIPEFGAINGDHQIYLNLPGIITPNQADEFFTKILTSMCAEYTRNGSMGTCKKTVK